MTTETQKTYHRNDLIDSIQRRLPSMYAEQSGAMSSVLSSILIHVEVYDPEMFQEIMQFEMRVEERMKELEDLAEFYSARSFNA